MFKRFILSVFFTLFSGSVMAIEEPTYRVIEKSGNFELRVYDPKIIAEVEVAGNLKQASNAGFKLIADYIFGNNTSQKGVKEKVSMTVPVTIQPKSEKISMTAPVSIKKSGQTWRMHFVMPSQYTMTSLPKPNNPAVTLRQIDGTKYAVIRFSGLTGENKVENKTAELAQWLKNKNISAKGKPELARYNPPWTVPFLRRNEVMVKY